MWVNIHDKVHISSDVELRDQILADLAHPKLSILDGPSMCGKTRFLKSLPAEITSITGLYLLVEDYVAGLRRFVKDHDALLAYKTNLIEKYRKKGQILCFEDIDMTLAGKPATQEEVAFLLRSIIEKDTVILTGIDIDKRCSELLSKFETFNCEHYKYTES